MNFQNYHLSGEASIITGKIPGDKSLKLLEKQNNLEGRNRSYPISIPIAFERAKGSIIEDVDKNRYIDFFAGCGALNVGHNNTDILEDIRKQEEKLIHALDFPTSMKIDFMEEIHSILPDNLQGKVKLNFCGPTGADAIEVALKLAKMNTQRHTVLSFQGAFHGMTLGALSVTGHLYHKKKLPSLEPGIHFMPYCYCYRCAFGKEDRSCNLECIQYIRKNLENPCSGIEQPAAIIVEPIQGEGGTIIPKKGFLNGIVEIGNDFKIPVIFDEIQSGFYRTGPFFSFENMNEATPDIITISKGLGGIGMPIAVTIFKKDMDTWEKGTHSGTFRGNQLSMAAGLSAIKFSKRHNLKKYVRELGKDMLDRLQSIQNNSKYIGDVRGIGMMFGIEYVKDKTTKTPFPEIVSLIRKKCYENGLLVEVGGHYSNVVRFLPPLITTKKIADEGLNIFERVSGEAEHEISNS